MWPPQVEQMEPNMHIENNQIDKEKWKVGGRRKSGQCKKKMLVKYNQLDQKMVIDLWHSQFEQMDQENSKLKMVKLTETSKITLWPPQVQKQENFKYK